MDWEITIQHFLKNVVKLVEIIQETTLDRKAAWSMMLSINQHRQKQKPKQIVWEINKLHTLFLRIVFCFVQDAEYKVSLAIFIYCIFDATRYFSVCSAIARYQWINLVLHIIKCMNTVANRS